MFTILLDDKVEWCSSFPIFTKEITDREITLLGLNNWAPVKCEIISKRNETKHNETKPIENETNPNEMKPEIGTKRNGN